MSASFLQIMKFQDLLTDNNSSSNDSNKRHQLEHEVERLQAELDGEVALNTVLNSALDGSSHPSHSLSSLLPPEVQALVAELAMVEEEIVWLERKIKDLKLGLYNERKLTQQQHRRPRRHGTNLQHRSRSLNSDHFNKVIKTRASMLSTPSTSSNSNEGFYERSRRLRHTETFTGKSRRRASDDIEKPNELSEELIKCLIGIFLELNRPCLQREGQEEEESAIIPKLTLSCINSRSFAAKNSSGFKEPTTFYYASSSLDPYSTLAYSDSCSAARDVGPYKNFIQITRHSLDASRFSECLPAMGKLRVLMNKLCTVDLTFLTYKQKLAFWINIYNACIMHAFLEHGLPSTQEKLLALMNKAALNVGGIVLNALAIEHFILRHPCESKHSPVDEKETLLRHAYGLGYPETNVTFALCRGSWSSPALRVYTPDNVANELGRARVEYLEASVGVTSKRKVVVPKLLQWHMLDFADDMESLLEWIYSQLPRAGALRRLVMECLSGYGKSHVVEIQPYEFEFRYLLPL